MSAPLKVELKYDQVAAKNDLPCAPSCERNKDAILDVLASKLANAKHIFEIGSGNHYMHLFFHVLLLV